MTGLMLDYDEGLSIAEAKEVFSEYHYILHTTTSHQKDIPGKSGMQDRFRIILPFAPDTYQQYNSEEAVASVYNQAWELFPAFDSACEDTGRHYFPFTGDNMELFDFEVHPGEQYLDLAPQVIQFPGTKFKLDTIIEDRHGKQYIVRELTEHLQQHPDKEKLRILCPKCGWDTSRTHPGEENAFFSLLDNGTPRIFCSSCKSRSDGDDDKGNYYLNAKESHTVSSDYKKVYYFRDLRTKSYYLLKYVTREERYAYFPINKEDIKNSMAYHGVTPPPFYDELEFIYDFASDNIVDRERETVNNFIAPEILKQEPQSHPEEVPYYTRKVMQHICGDDAAVYERLVNHLAIMVQERKKMRTTFLFQGVQGTGKGMWFNHCLLPIFGNDYGMEITQRAFEKEFNEFLESNYVILVNEVNLDFSARDDISDNLKTGIADHRTPIEAKGIDIRAGDNNANLFFATNKRAGAVKLEPGDRRWNVGAYQETTVHDKSVTWWKSDAFIEEQLDNELPEFVDYLKQHPIQQYDRPVVHNRAREVIIEFSKSYTEQFFEAVRAGDLRFFYNHLCDDSGKFSKHNTEKSPHQIIFEQLNNNDGEIRVEDLRILYNNITDKQDTPQAFGRKYPEYGFESQQGTQGNNAGRKCLSVQWKILPAVSENGTE